MQNDYSASCRLIIIISHHIYVIVQKDIKNKEKLEVVVQATY